MNETNYSWTFEPTQFSTRYMAGEGYQIPLNKETDTLEPYELDRFAREWLKKQGHPVRDEVKAWRQFCVRSFYLITDNTLFIMSFVYAKDLISS